MGNAIKTTVLLALMSAVLLVLGELLGGRSGLIMAFGMAIVMNFTSYWFSDRIVLAMYKATPVGPEHPLSQVTARLAARAGLPMPKVYVIPGDSPNAFATGRSPSHAAVAATEGLLRILDEREVEGVLAHELAHVKHRDILISSIAATMGAAIMMIARMAQFAAMFGGGRRNDREGGGNPLAMIATIILAPLAAMLIQAAISRSREFGAMAWSTPCASSRWPPNASRWTPTRRPRTCSSSSRSACRGCCHCSARTRPPMRASRRCSASRSGGASRLGERGSVRASTRRRNRSARRTSCGTCAPTRRGSLRRRARPGGGA
jgi:heat shock protein HtpX